MSRHTPPIGDIDLSGDHPDTGERIRDGGVGPDGTSASVTGRLGGLRDTADGAGAMGEPEDPESGPTDGSVQTTLGDIVSDVPDDREDDADDLDYNDPDLEQASSSRVGQDDIDAIGDTEHMTGTTGGQAGTSR